jgi:hypothetical protein
LQNECSEICRAQSENPTVIASHIFRMSFLSILTTILSLVAGLFAVRELKILCEGDVERFQVVRAVALVTMTITPYIMPDPWSGITVIAGSLALLVSFFLEPRRS